MQPPPTPTPTPTLTSTPTPTPTHRPIPEHAQLQAIPEYFVVEQAAAGVPQKQRRDPNRNLEEAQPPTIGVLKEHQGERLPKEKHLELAEGLIRGILRVDHEVQAAQEAASQDADHRVVEPVLTETLDLVPTLRHATNLDTGGTSWDCCGTAHPPPHQPGDLRGFTVLLAPGPHLV